MIHELVIATHNRGKLAEIKALLEAYPIKIYSLDDFNFSDTEETGLTFVENALLKARAVCEQTGLPALADDSGLVVEALNGEPGLYSARYAGEHGNHDKNIEKLLTKLNGQENRKAYFCCTMALLKHATDPSPLIAEGRWHGEILTAKRGTNGFGYDPVFLSPEHQCSAAELSQDIKNKISHRGKALQQLIKQLATP